MSIKRKKVEEAVSLTPVHPFVQLKPYKKRLSVTGTSFFPTLHSALLPLSALSEFISNACTTGHFTPHACSDRPGFSS